MGIIKILCGHSDCVLCIFELDTRVIYRYAPGSMKFGTVLSNTLCFVVINFVPGHCDV